MAPVKTLQTVLTPVVALAASARSPADIVIPMARARAVLPEDIPSAIATADLSNRKHLTLFVTGANGLLGLQVLHELAHMVPSPQVITLVRADSESAAHKRLADAAKEAGCVLPQKLQVLVGDVTLPKFGLGGMGKQTTLEWLMRKDAWTKLAETVDIVIHSAAAVNWGADYTELEDANVRAVEDVVRFACVGKAKRVISISSCSAASCCEPWGPVHETEDVEDPEWMRHVERGGNETALHYRLSKWTGEKLILLAAKRGLNASVVRPPILFAGPNGAMNAKDTPARLLHAIISTRSVPAQAYRVTWGTVGLCAAVIMANLRSGRLVVHQPPQSMDVSQIVRRLQGLGYGPFTAVSHEEWVQRAQSSRLAPLLSLNIFSTQWFDVQPLVTDAPEPAAWIHPFDEELFDRAVHFLVGQGKLPLPASTLAPPKTAVQDAFLGTATLIGAMVAAHAIRSKLLIRSKL